MSLLVYGRSLLSVIKLLPVPWLRLFSMTEKNRPLLTSQLTGAELLNWYWLKLELLNFAKQLGIRASGSKELLTQRIAAYLDGVPFTEPRATKGMKGTQLIGPLTFTTVIPSGQRCSQVVRAWFIEQVGATFRFDAAMRAFFSETDGTQTMNDALDYYRETRDRGSKPIDPQFEYNRFTRSWYQANPTGRREDLFHDWQEYRSLPLDQRGRA